MTAKDIRFGDDARQAMMEGARILARAVKATLGPVEEGVVPGGGVALVRMQQALLEHGLTGANHDQNIGINIVLRAMEQPLREIVTNAGMEPSVILNKVKEGQGGFGYNAQSDAFGDLLEMGVLDPAKVVRVALQNAASIAGLMITTEAMIAEKRRSQAPAVPGPGPADWDV